MMMQASVAYWKKWLRSSFFQLYIGNKQILFDKDFHLDEGRYSGYVIALNPMIFFW